MSQSGDLRGALVITRALLRLRHQRLGDQHPDFFAEVGAMGALADRAGKLGEARQMLERAYNGLRSVAGGRDLRLAVVAGNLAWHHLRANSPDQAERCLEQAYLIRKDQAPETTGPIAAQLAELFIRRDKTAEAVPLLQEAWERYRDAYGPLDARAVARARTLASILVAQERTTEAIPVLRVVYDAASRDGDGELRAQSAFQMGSALEELGRREEAFRLVEESVRWTREHLGENEQSHPDLSTRLAALSRMVVRRGRPSEGEGLMMEAYEADRRAYGDSSPEVAMRCATIGHLCAQTGRRAEAMGWLEPAASLLRSHLGDAHAHTRFAVEELVRLWIEEGKDALKHRDVRHARDTLTKARDLASRVLGARHWAVDEINKLGLP